jgi:hypothetical protein
MGGIRRCPIYVLAVAAAVLSAGRELRSEPVSEADISQADRLVRQLSRLSLDEHGRLIDQTTIMIGTEMGRFNHINMYQGRDHWPENSWLFAGRGIRKQPGGVTIGKTDRIRRSMPIDYATGRAVETGGRWVFIDNAFATLARAAGLDPTAFGYKSDQVVSALLA